MTTTEEEVAASEPLSEMATAESILKQGLAVLDLDERRFVVLDLKMLHQENGREEEAEALQEREMTTAALEAGGSDLPPDVHGGKDGDGRLTLDEIIDRLERCKSDELPGDAIREARNQRAEIIPRLIEVVQSATRRVQNGEDVSGWGHLIALMLLSEFQATEALPAIVEACSLPGEWSYDLLGDWILEKGARILAGLAAQTPEVVDRLIADREADGHIRWEAAEVYRHWVRDGRFSRDEAVARLRKHLIDALAADDDVAGFLVYELAVYSPREALAEIEEAYDRNLVDGFLIARKEIAKCLEEGASWTEFELRSCGPTGIRDTIEELTPWMALAAKHEADAALRPSRTGRHSLEADDEWNPPEAWEQSSRDDDIRSGAPIRNAEPKVGRNDPCPCGSGKKHKKCCGRN